MRLALALMLTWLALVPINSFAGDIKFNGFASVVSGIDLGDENARADYNNTSIDNLQESRLGLQLTADLGEGARFIGQAIARGDAAEGFVSNYEWAYFDFNVGSSGKFKAGRIRIPFYKYSDYLDVGVAYHWITPPPSMYSLSFSNVDGFGYLHNFQLGPLESTINLVYGRYQGTLFLAGTPVASELRNLGAANWSFNYQDHEFYIAYAFADVLVPAAAADNLAAGADAASLDGDKVRIDGDYGYFIGGGYKGTFGNIGVYFEFSTVDVVDSAFAKTQGGYLGASYTMNDYTYHITLEQDEATEKDFSETVADAAILPDGSSINSNLRSLGNGDSSTITVGVRKDISYSTAIKFDISQYVEDRFQDSSLTSSSEERTGTYVKLAFETMF